ncbi:MAG: PEP/pyruvate-binding domain-containing protein [Bacteroidia bacterium]
MALLGVAAKAQQGQPDFLHQLASKDDFDLLKGKPLTAKYGMVESVKLVWDLRAEKMYYISGKRWEWHYEFCRDKLGFLQSNYLFNEANYGTGTHRRYTLANLNYFPADERWTLEFSSADLIPLELVTDLYGRVVKSTFIGDKIQIFLNTPRLQSILMGGKLPYILPDAIYAGLVYQPLNCKRSFGYLRRVPVATLDSLPPGATDIVVLDGPALDIPAVAGLISPDFQTPLSHLNVLCKNRGTPYLAQKGIWTDSLILAMENKLVRFEVYQDSFRLVPADLNEATKFWEAQRPGKVQKLKPNLKTSGLQSLEKLGLHTVNLVGGKASNFSILSRLAADSQNKFRVPEGAFAIPFYWYWEHFEASGAMALAQKLVSDPSAKTDTKILRQRLLEIQNAFLRHPVNGDLVQMVEERIRKSSPTLRMRFRSSTNAEDIEGFNGAGLYESRTGIVGDTARSVAEAIRDVWASLWNIRAYQEREYFRIDHMRCAMGLLVHRGFPDERANGVAITKNLYRPDYYGFVINVQAGETSVVSPPPGVECDQLICYSDSDLDFYKKKRVVEYITYGNQNGGKPVLSPEEVILLTEQLAAIKKHYWGLMGARLAATGYYDEREIARYNRFALDLEFKFDGEDRVLYIKQVRPYRD